MFIVYLEKIINAQYDNNLVILSLIIAFDIILKGFIKYLIKMKYMIQSIYIQKAKTKNHTTVNYSCSCMLIYKQKIVCAAHHLKNSVGIIDQKPMSFPQRLRCQF